MDVRIADYDTNEVYSDFSKPGEIQVKGPCVMKGYFKNETATLEAFTNDGWLKTGDKGHFNKDGELVYDGRLKHTIVLSNGENGIDTPTNMSSAKWIIAESPITIASCLLNSPQINIKTPATTNPISS